MYSRRVINSKNSLVENGVYTWGTFNTAFKNVNPLDAHRPFGFPLPRFIKNFRLKEWQAFQAGNKDWFIFGAVYNAKITAVNILSVYHRKTGILHHYQKLTGTSSLSIASGLFDSRSSYESKDLSLVFENQLEKGIIGISGFGKGMDLPQLEIALKCFHNTEPIVISQPFGKNRGLYSHKALMSIDGVLKIENQVVEFDQNESFCIMDDHKGYYPYSVKYDWVTAAGFKENGVLCGFNLTDNQVRNHEQYNENCLWYDGKMYPLPPIKIIRNNEYWEVKDCHGWVNLKFFPKTDNRIRQNFLIVKSDYEGPYGEFEGVISIPEKISVDFTSFFGMGEKKRYRM